MTDITNNIITHTRGDTLRAKVDLFHDKEKTKPYIIEDGDSVRFALKKPRQIKVDKGYTEYEDVEPLVLKDVPVDTLILHLEPIDTKHLSFGKYEYDIQIVHSDGTTDTFIPPTLFNLTKEVH